jgi:serine/threonine protein kinase
LPVSVLQSWLAQLCDALDFSWRRYQAIHGDLCPQNLLVTGAEEFRILDFGLARSLYDLPGPTGTPLITGTQAYVSPERARGLSVAVTDDVYGFGATVYELLTSRPVFFRGNLLWQLESVVPPTMTERRAEFGLAGEPIPPEWEEVIAACLAKRREDRPRDLREVGERLGC